MIWNGGVGTGSVVVGLLSALRIATRSDPTSSPGMLSAVYLTSNWLN